MYPCYSLGLCAWSEFCVLQCIELRSSRAQSALCEQTRKAPLVVFVAPVIDVVVIVLVVAVDDGRCLYGPVSVHHMVKYMRVRFPNSPDLCVCFVCWSVCNGQVYQFAASLLVVHSLFGFVARSADVLESMWWRFLVSRICVGCV